MRWALLTISLLLAWPSKAQNLYSTGTCETALADTYLEVGNVRARLFNNGALFWRGQPHVYEVPAGSGIQASFSTNFLIAGFVEDDVRVAGSTYGPYEFWPGPIPQDGSSPTSCNSYDRFWELDYKNDIFKSSPSDAPTQLALEWPTDLGAPFVEINGTPGYQPQEGDYPEMNGDRQVFWVMNDRGGEHGKFKSLPLGVEVQASAFGFDGIGDLANITFYRYRIENKGSKTIEDAGVGLFADIDLGYFADDYVGTDTTLSMLYFYNADNDDEGPDGYGIAPPAIGISIIEASHVNGSLPSDLGAEPGEFLSATMMPPGGGGFDGDPDTAQHIHHYINGRWKNGLSMTEGGNGFGFSQDPIPFAYPGDPVTASFWSEVNAGWGRPIAPADRRAYVSFSSFDLAPGEWAQFTFAIIWARGESNLDSVAQLREAARFTHGAKPSILSPRTNATQFIDGNPPETPQHPFWVDEPYPNPADDQITLRMSLKWDAPVSIRLIDTLGREWLDEQFGATAGPVTKSLPIGNVAPGTYLIRVSQRGEHVDHTVIVL